MLTLPETHPSFLALPGQLLQPGGRAHLVGIAGAGMRSLAGVLATAGWNLSGSDSGCVADLPQSFGAVHGHSTDFLNRQPELVIYSPAIGVDHVELIAARARGIPVVSYPEMLGLLMRCRTGIAVAGTHGKSTVAAMVASILLAADLDPLVVCGAECSRYGGGPFMVTEACEYRSSFLHLQPTLAAILNIEPDHFDYYRSPDHLESEFLTFAHGVNERGTLVLAAECAATARVAARCKRRGVTFGTSDRADWRADRLSVERGCYHFRLLETGRRVADVALRVPGRHNVLNATAAAALAATAGVPHAAIATGLREYRGLKRRLQRIGTAGGVVFIDDYAHHPTEISAALQTVREQSPAAKIACIFEPHQAGRTKSLRAELAAALQKADTLAITEIFRAREGDWKAGDLTASDLADQIRSTGARVFSAHSTGEIADWIVHRVATGELAEGDVVLTLGAGRIGNLAHGVYQRVRELRTNE